MTTPIDRLLAYQLDARHFPGALVHVERDGEVIARRAVGRLRPDADAPMHDGALFRLASLTKPVVTVAALTQFDEGRLALDAPAADFLPALADVRLPSGERPPRAPSVRDLMRHTAGFAYPGEIREARVRDAVQATGLSTRMPFVDVDAFVEALASSPLAAAPGTRFQYGYATDVLGAIVARVDGTSLGEALRRRVFAPLGMAHAAFEIADADEPRLAVAHADDAAWHALIPPFGRRRAGQPWMESGGGGLVSTLDDFAAFARMLAHGGRVGAGRLLSETAFAELARDQLPDGVDGPANYTGPGFGFGLGVAVRLDWGAAAMPCAAGEMTWSGLSGTAMFVDPRRRWFALAFTANTGSRLVARMEFRRAAAAR